MFIRGRSKDGSSRKVTPPSPSYMSNDQFGLSPPAPIFPLSSAYLHPYTHSNGDPKQNTSPSYEITASPAPAARALPPPTAA